MLGVLIIGGVWFVNSQRGTDSEGGTVIGEDAAEGSSEDDAVTEDEEGLFGNTDERGASSEVKEFTITGEDYSFSETNLTVNEGDTVRITFVNGGAMPHDWVLDEFGAATDILQSGEEEIIEFVAGDLGTYEYYCSVGSHRELGMVGTLTVE